MKKLIIATHGYMARGIKSSLSIIAGDVSDVIDINAFTEECPNLEDTVDKLLSQYSDEDLLVLTDVYFGGVNQVFMRAKKTRAFPLITGVNLPMVLELFHFIGETITDEEIREAVESGCNACKIVDVGNDLAAQTTDETEEL